MSSHLKVDSILQAFNKFDQNKDGLLEEQEIFLALSSLGMLSMENCQKFTGK